MPGLSQLGGRLAVVLLSALVAAVLVGGGNDEPAAPAGPRAIDRELLAAAYENDVATARRLIDEGADVNQRTTRSRART